MKEHGHASPPILFTLFQTARPPLLAQLLRAILGQRQEILATAAIAATFLAGITFFLQQLAEHGW